MMRKTTMELAACGGEFFVVGYSSVEILMTVQLATVLYYLP
jgi:hypothetical protein